MVAGFSVLLIGITPNFNFRVRGFQKLTTFNDFQPWRLLLDKRKLRVATQHRSVVISHCLAAVDKALVKTNKRGTGWDITSGQ
jgi:hypothetical protein